MIIPATLALSSLALAATLARSIVTPSTPASIRPQTKCELDVRNAHAMTFDAVRRATVMFGGADASRVRNDTCAWSGDEREWMLVTDQGPSARTFPAMAFDEAHGEVVLFGGNRVLFGEPTESNTLLDDTWVLRGSTWTQKSTRGGPSARAEAAMTYDKVRKRIVLFGGYSRTARGRLRLGDTWEWDGDRWFLAATDGPAPRNGAALAFDASRARVVLSGGPPAFADASTWEWDGRSWRVQKGPDPPARFNPVMVYHDAMKGLVRFGGWTGGARAAETWIRANREWREASVNGPSARNHTSMSYDASRQRTVLFGGHDGELVFGDTWEFDGSAWHLMAASPPRRRVGNNH